MTVTFDDALDELYGIRPEEFVLVRSRLEQELKAAGDTEGATAIKRLRRPHLAAWACNQLARDDAEAISELFESTAQVAAAQQRTIGGGDADDLRAATRHRQELLDELVDAGLRALARHAPKPAQYRDNIASTLDAATLDPEAAALLRAGRLTQPLLPPSGFGPLDPTTVPGAEPRPARKPTSREREKARRELERVRRTEEELAAAADEADSEAASADLATQSALGHLQEVDRAQARARDALAEANVRLTEARTRAEEARLALREATARVETAQARLETLES